MLKGKLQIFANTYESMYNEGKGSIYQMQNLGLNIPEEFKISAQYVLKNSLMSFSQAQKDLLIQI